MAYEIDEIKQSQSIFYYLLENRELCEEDEKQLYKSYTENENVMNLVKSQGNIAKSDIVRYGNVIYLIPKEDNDYLGYSKNNLKSMLCRSGATDKDYYLSQFVILTLLVEFYNGQGASSLTREYMRVGELMNCVSDRLREGAAGGEADEKSGLAFSNMSEAYDALRSDEKSKAKTTKEGFIHKILTFLHEQGLIEYIEADEMIKTTTKLNNFMDWNLLNKNNFARVLKVLGVNIDE